jgi:uridine kinase
MKPENRMTIQVWANEAGRSENYATAIPAAKPGQPSGLQLGHISAFGFRVSDFCPALTGARKCCDAPFSIWKRCFNVSSRNPTARLPAMSLPKLPANRPPRSIRSRSGAGAHAAVLIAIAGGSGSGKTWLAGELHRRLRPHVGLLSLDDFYRDLSHLPLTAREGRNFDAPGALDWPLFVACLAGIRAGQPVSLPRYDFTTHTREPQPRRWQPRSLVIVEGLWPWWRRDLPSLYAWRIYQDCPPEVCLARRIERDVQERGRTEASVRAQWRQQVHPMFVRFVQPQAASANVVLTAEPTTRQMNSLEQKIRQLAALPAAVPPRPPRRAKEGVVP